MAKDVTLTPEEAEELREVMVRLITAWRLNRAENPVLMQIHDKLTAASIEPDAKLPGGASPRRGALRRGGG
jgi:hypothetical protein